MERGVEFAALQRRVNNGFRHEPAWIQQTGLSKLLTAKPKRTVQRVANYVISETDHKNTVSKTNRERERGDKSEETRKKDHWQVTDFKKRHHYLFDKERSMYTLFSICSLIRRHETNSTFQFLFPSSVISFSFQVLSLSLSILLSRFHRVRQLLWQDRHRVLKSVFRTKQMLEIINIFISIFYW